MASGPAFTKEQRKRIELLVVDCLTFSLSEKESLAYIALRAPDLAGLQPREFRRYKAKVQSDPYFSHWLNQFVKVGYVRTYKDLVDEMQAIQKKLKRWLLEEESLPASPAELAYWKKQHPDQPAPRLQNPWLRIAICGQIIATNRRLSQLINSGPVAAKIHAILQVVDPMTPEHERKRVLGDIFDSEYQ